MLLLSSVTDHSGYRRPCLLRSLRESDVDAAQGRRVTRAGYPHPGGVQGPPPSENRHSPRGGGQLPDRRAMHIDMEPGFGMRKGRSRSPSPSEQTKTESIQGWQVYGVGGDIDSTHKRGSVDTESNMLPRTKSEKLRALPAGADIDLVQSRRRLSGRFRSPDACGPQERQDLSWVSIDHQFSRRRRPTSCPSRSESCDCSERRADFEHRVKAEAYAQLLDRPEGMGNIHVPASARPFSPRSFRRMRSPQRSPDRVEISARGPKRNSQSGNAAPSPQSPEFALIDALRSVTRNASTEKAWDSMLKTLELQPWMLSELARSAPRGLLDEATLRAHAANPNEEAEAEASPLPSATQSPAASPVSMPRQLAKDIEILDSPQMTAPVSTQKFFQRKWFFGSGSDSSGLSSATTCDSDGRGSTGLSIPTSSTATTSTFRPAQGTRQPAARRIIRAEDWKARRRAGWRST
mmetsp:Transcript_63960/g.152539  ORF Transcript_63960/g.152539 Transcript_63960/m.152539 type:complete len:463 (+) Transcript_63960:122-1510(+)